MESADQDDTHSAIFLSAARDIVESRLLLTALAHPGKRAGARVTSLATQSQAGTRSQAYCVHVHSMQAHGA